MNLDIDMLWQLFEKLQDKKPALELRGAFCARFHDLNSVMTTDWPTISEEFQLSDGSRSALDLLRKASLSMLLAQIEHADDEDLLASIRIFSRAYFSLQARNSVLVFYFRDKKFLLVDEPGIGTLFHYDAYPRDIICRALQVDANALYLSFGNFSETKESIDHRVNFVSCLKDSGLYLDVKVFDPIVLPITIPKLTTRLPV